MTKSTIDDQSGDGGFDIGSSVDDLFGDIADEEVEDEPVDRETDDDSGFGGSDTDDDDDGIEDQTAANVFGELKDDVDTETGGADEVLGSETPEDIIASADEPIREPESPIDDLLASKEELADLLLTGRTKEEEFLWVETESDAETDADANADSDAAADPDAATNPDREINPDAEPAPDADADTDAAADSPTAADDSSADDAARESASDPEIVSDTDGDTDTPAGVEDDPRDIEQIIEDRASELDDGEPDDASVASSRDASGSATASNSTDDGRSDSTADEKPTGVVGLLRSLLGGFF